MKDKFVLSSVDEPIRDEAVGTIPDTDKEDADWAANERIEHNGHVYLYGQAQIDELKRELDEETDEIMKTIHSITPIYAVSFVTKEGQSVHFANFYGTTIEYSENQDQAYVETKSRENDKTIYEMIQSLEDKINAGKHKKVNKDLSVEVNWAKFGGFIHKRQSEIEDAIYCDSVEKAFALFKHEYAKISKSEKQILAERRKQFEESLKVSLESFWFDD